MDKFMMNWVHDYGSFLYLRESIFVHMNSIQPARNCGKQFHTNHQIYITKLPSETYINVMIFCILCFHLLAYDCEVQVVVGYCEVHVVVVGSHYLYGKLYGLIMVTHYVCGEDYGFIVVKL